MLTNGWLPDVNIYLLLTVSPCIFKVMSCWLGLYIQSCHIQRWLKPAFVGITVIRFFFLEWHCSHLAYWTKLGVWIHCSRHAWRERAHTASFTASLKTLLIFCQVSRILALNLKEIFAWCYVNTKYLISLSEEEHIYYKHIINNSIIFVPERIHCCDCLCGG